MNAITSLCRLCTDPTRCELCELVRNPRALSTTEIARLRVRMKRNPTARALQVVDVDHAANERKRALQAEIDALRAEVERRKAALAPRASPPAVVPDPMATVPTAPPRDVRELQPAPAALPAPAVVLERENGVRETFDPTQPLAPRDWLGLAARVDAGLISQKEAERIGRAWLEGAVTANA